MATIIRHESWISPASTIAAHAAIDSARLDVATYQLADPTNYHAVDVYDLPRSGHWRVFSQLAVTDLVIDEVINLCCAANIHNIINADTTTGGYYCTPTGMLKYGAAELSQRSINADEMMLEPDLLRNYILGDLSELSEAHLKKATAQFGAIVSALDEASREIDYWIARITTTPLSNAVPIIIRDITCRIARYRLARYEYGDVDDSRVYRDYKQAVDMLRDLADGKATIPEFNQPPTANNNSRYAVIAPTAYYNAPTYNNEGWR